MAIFNFKINEQQVELGNLPDSPLRKSLEGLKTTITNQIQSLRCDIHHQELVVVLESKENEVRLVGFSTCCREFGLSVREHLKLPEEYGNPVVISRTVQFTYNGESQLRISLQGAGVPAFGSARSLR